MVNGVFLLNLCDPKVDINPQADISFSYLICVKNNEILQVVRNDGYVSSTEIKKYQINIFGQKISVQKIFNILKKLKPLDLDPSEFNQFVEARDDNKKDFKQRIRKFCQEQEFEVAENTLDDLAMDLMKM